MRWYIAVPNKYFANRERIYTTMIQNDLLSFGALLKSFRTRRHFTQQQLAVALGMHRHAVGRWEQGDFLPASKAIVLEAAKQLHLSEQETRQLLETSLIAHAPHWLLPLPRNPFFTGREEILETLHVHLGVEQAMALTQSYALYGLGGVGKTQIALEYAYRYALEYNAVFWIGAETSETIVSGLLHIAEVLQLPGRDDKDQQRVVAAVQRWLTTHNQWLLIWDNVEDLALFRRSLPPTRQGAILITMRRQALGTLARGIDLLPMEQEDGILFLLRRTKILQPEVTSEQMCQFASQMPSSYTAAAELVTVMGGLPLALDQAGAYIEETQCGIPAYLELFRSQRVALLQQRGEELWNHPESVTTTFTLAITMAVACHPAVSDLLQVCALLQPDGIPEELFGANATYPGTALAPLTTNPLAFDHVISILLSLSLVKRQPEAHTLSIHRLMQAVQLERMSKQAQALWQRRVLHALNSVFPEVTPEVWGQCERLLPHMLACASVVSDAAEEDLIAVLRKAANYLQARAQYDQAEPLYQRAVALGEKVLEREHPDLATLLNELGTLYTAQGKYEQAKPLYQQALQIRERVFSSEHPLIADSLHEMAHLHSLQGDFQKSEVLFKQALQIWEQTFGCEHALTARVCYRLAALYLKQGRLDEAEPLYQRALQIQERILGLAHPEWATSLNGLAILYQEQGKYEQAESLFRQVQQIREQLFGPEHPQVAVPLFSLALISAQQGRLDEAESLYQRTLQIWEQALGPTHPDVASPLNGLANIYLRQEKLELAQLLGQRALQIWEQALGPTHPNVGYPLNTLATIYHKQGKLELAQPLYWRSLQIWEQAFGSEHPTTAVSLNGLANLLSLQERDEQAETFYQRALQIREQQLGHHPDTAQTLHDLALFREKQGRLSEALSLASQTLHIRSQLLGDTHSETVATQALYTQLIQKEAQALKEVAAESNTEGTPDPYNKELHIAKASLPLYTTIDPSSAENDPLQAFLAACCELHPRAWCRSADLWNAYECWVQKYQEHFPLSRRGFTAQMKAHGYRADRTESARIWRGVSIIPQAPQQNMTEHDRT
jgi:tetratricopeptide (TPR) repeat protein/transcriptional regulator with XRE-family HTH domain